MPDFWGWRPYVPAASRRRKALQELEKRQKQGHSPMPVIIEGRAIAKTFWGKAWCDNLERYSDYSNRLPRGRTYVRNGAVIDLQIAAGTIEALVSGSQIYQVSVKIAPVGNARWKSICTDCAGGIDSLVELLQGRFSKAVMERICRQKTGLFPSPQEIELSCSCPDSAEMCKHVAAVLYGIGAQLDREPELLFRLHQLDHAELIAKAGSGLPLSKPGLARSKVLASDDLANVFGLDMAQSAGADAPAGAKRQPRKGRPATKSAAMSAASEGPAKKTPGRKTTKENVPKRRPASRNKQL